MAEQLGFLQTGYGGRLEVTLRHRRTDPPTSVAAARDLVASGRLTDEQRIALRLLVAYGPGTTHEIAAKALQDPYFETTQNDTQIHHMLARRLPEMKEHARVQRVNGKAVVRDNSRVWERMPQEETA